MNKTGTCRVFTLSSFLCISCAILAYCTYFFYTDESNDITFKTLNIWSQRLILYILPSIIALLIVLGVPAYLMCLFKEPMKVPDQYTLTKQELAKFMLQQVSGFQGSYERVVDLTREYQRSRPNLIVRERDHRHGGLRVCEICSVIKPDRSHHCTICNTCVLRMDHHCYWVNNCIHEGTHKYFIQIVTIGTMLCTVVLVDFSLLIDHFCQSWPKAGDTKYCPCLITYAIIALIGIVTLLLIFLTLDHCFNLFRGQTSFEREYDRDHYSRGCCWNFKSIMGSNIFQWALPIPASQDQYNEETEPLIVTIHEDSGDYSSQEVFNTEETLSLQPQQDVLTNNEPRARNTSTIDEDINEPGLRNDRSASLLADESVSPKTLLMKHDP